MFSVEGGKEGREMDNFHFILWLIKVSSYLEKQKKVSYSPSLYHLTLTNWFNHPTLYKQKEQPAFFINVAVLLYVLNIFML